MPAVSGPPRHTLTGAGKRADTAARLTISRELGHGRIEIVAVYMGS